MGAKHTKIEDSHSPSTPITRSTSTFVEIDTDNNSLDPRSPAEYRTPIHLQNERTGANVPLCSVDMLERDSNYQSTLNVLRKRFFKSFTYNLYDPRSPNVKFNRTPLTFEDTLEKSFSLDDTFADLLVESRLPETINQLVQSEEKEDKKYKQDIGNEMPEDNVIDDLEEPVTAPKTPTALQQEFDPRSPSVGVERTPILFADDEADDTNEDIMLESILASLSLNLNTTGNSSVLSITPQNVDVILSDKIDSKPINKHLDCVRARKKKSSKANHLKPKLRSSYQQIYEDQENNMPVTPKFKGSQTDKNDSLKGKRTPLSCVRNHTQFRSRSVESFAKSIKTRLALTSFDDTLNPTESYKVPNLYIVQQNEQN